MRTRTRLGLAGVVTAVMVAGLGASGGFSSAANSISSFTHSVTRATSSSAPHSIGGPGGRTGGDSGPITADSQYGAAPTVNDDFSPNPAWTGATVTVNGTNFSGINQLTNVQIGSEDASFLVTSNTSVNVTVPSDSTGGLITVTNATDSATTSTSLVIVGAPDIQHIATNGSADTSEGGVGSSVVITGANFQLVTSVQFNKKTATFTKSNDGTEIDTTIPAGTPANTLAKPGSLVVSGPGGSATASYVVDATAPTISAFTISTGKTYALQGNTITASGKNIVSGTTLSFSDGSGGFIAGDNQNFIPGATAATNKVSADVPSGAKTGVLQISNDQGATNSAKALTIVGNAVITSFKPNFGKAGAAAGKVGDMITITGSSLTAIAGTTDTVTFPGGATATAKPTNDTTLKVGVPFGATGTGTLQVDNGSGTPGTSSDTFYVLTTPSITSEDPTHASAGAVIAITGSHFIGAKSVSFNGKPASKFVVASDTEIDATIAPSTPGTATAAKLGIVVTNSVGSGQDNTFVVDQFPPTITKITAHGLTAAVAGAAASDSLDISGAFLNTADTVSFCSTDLTTCASTTVGTAGTPTKAVTTINVTVPDGATSGVILVDNGSGLASKPFTIFSAPTLVAFSPGYGVAGNKVTITGTNLAQVSEVDFVGTGVTPITKVAAGVVHNKNGSITVSVPAKTDTENMIVIKVKDPANSSNVLSDSSGSQFVFDIVSKPAGITVDDGGNDHVAGQQITLNGTNLQGITAVKFGKVSAAFNPVSNGSGGIDTTKLSVTIPAGATSGKITVYNAAATGGVATAAVFPVLVVTKVGPSTQKVGKTFTLTGSGFKSGVTLATVTINGITATVKGSDTALTVTVPSTTAGTYDIVVTSQGWTVTVSNGITVTT